MPTIYISTNFQASVSLSSDEDDFTFEQWTDEGLAKERQEYDRPNKGICLHIVNPNDKVEVFPINITEKDIYEGSFEVSRNKKTFTFSLNGKAKVSIHKMTKEKIDLGLVPRVAGLILNGQEYSLDMPIIVSIQSKKI